MIIGTLAETCEYSWLNEESIEDAINNAGLDYVNNQEGGAKKMLNDLEAIYKKANAKCPLNWADKMLTRLRHFGRKLETAEPRESGVAAKAFHKIKVLVGKIIKKLSSVVGRAIGTGERAGQAMDFILKHPQLP